MGFHNQKDARIGQTYISSNGYEATCVEYNNAADILIEFKLYPIQLHTQWSAFCHGRFRFPIGKYGGINDVGCLDKDKKVTKEYETWCSMFKRCYSDSVRRNRPTYENKTVCDEWILYSSFLNWIQSQENYHKWLSDDNWQLDKDILQKGNSEYAPDKCSLVPDYVNNLFVKCDYSRGEYPLGVHYDKESQKYKAQCQNPIIKKYVNLGKFETINEAFEAYKNYKERQIKEVANREYKAGNITESCYTAMINYQVEITD